MGTAVFYMLGIILPTIAILFTFGHFVYKLGDYYENNSSFPKFILLLIFNLFLLTIVLLDDYHVLMMSNSTNDAVSHHPSLMISMLCWSFLIIYDCCMMNGMIRRIKDIDTYIHETKHRIYRLRYLYVVKLFIILGLLITLVIGLFSNTFNLFTWLILLYIYNSWNINKYIKNIIEKTS